MEKKKPDPERDDTKSDAKSRPVGRMPERSEAISGDEKKGLTVVSAAQSEEAKSAKLEKIVEAEPSTSKL